MNRKQREIQVWEGALRAYSNDAHLAFEVADFFGDLAKCQADAIASATYLYWAQILNYAEWGDRVRDAVGCDDLVFCEFASAATRQRAAQGRRVQR